MQIAGSPSNTRDEQHPYEAADIIWQWRLQALSQSDNASNNASNNPPNNTPNNGVDDNATFSLPTSPSPYWPWLGHRPWMQQIALQFPQHMALELQFFANGMWQGSAFLRASVDGREWHSLTSPYSPGYQWLAQLVPSQRLQLLYDALSDLVPWWRTCQLAPLAVDTHTAFNTNDIINLSSQHNALHAYHAQRWQHHYVASHNWTAGLMHQPDALADYWQKRSSLLKNTIQRRQKKLLAAGATWQIYHQIDAGLRDDYWRVYQHSWKSAEGCPQFINWLLDYASTEGSLRLGVLRMGNQAIACQLWLVQEQHAAIYKLAQDVRYDAWSPGTVLTAAMIDAVLQHDQVVHIDFLTGNDRYKAQWMDAVQPQHGLMLYHHRQLQSRLGWYWQWTKNQLKRLRRDKVATADPL
jgi:hypothetical protein